jgi:hypothetical protein
MASRSNSRRKNVPKKNVLAKTRGKKKASADKKQHVAKDFSFTPKTELGKKLWELRSRAVASGMKLLNSEELEQEILSRRGGVLTDD